VPVFIADSDVNSADNLPPTEFYIAKSAFAKDEVERTCLEKDIRD
jgi:hypothetical protein